MRVNTSFWRFPKAPKVRNIYRLGRQPQEHRLNIPIRDYLASVLPGLADRPISQTAELTPAAWVSRSSSATPPTSFAV